MRILARKRYYDPVPPNLVTMAFVSAEHNWLVEHHAEVEKYGGRWIAIVGEELVSDGKTLQGVYRKALKRNPGKIPLVTYVPRRGEELLIV